MIGGCSMTLKLFGLALVNIIEKIKVSMFNCLL